MRKLVIGAVLSVVIAGAPFFGVSPAGATPSMSSTEVQADAFAVAPDSIVNLVGVLADPGSGVVGVFTLNITEVGSGVEPTWTAVLNVVDTDGLATYAALADPIPPSGSSVPGWLFSPQCNGCDFSGDLSFPSYSLPELLATGTLTFNQ